MKKYIVSITFMLVFLFIFTDTLNAIETDDVYKYQYEKYGVEKIDNAVPEAAKDFAEDQILQIQHAGELFDFKQILTWIFQTFMNLLFEKKSMFIQLAALLILMYIVKTLCSGLSSSKTVEVLNYFAVICASVMIFSSVFSVSKNLVSTFEQLSSFSAVALPVLTGLVGASGLPLTAVGLSGTTVFILDVLAFIGGVCIVPIVNTYMALGLGACLTDNENLKSISKFCKNVCIFIITLLFCIFIGVVSLQSILSNSSDSLSKRAIMFTTGNFIPVAGGYISEGVNIVFSCASALKGTVGAFSAAILFFTVAAPITDIIVNLFILGMARMFCDFFDNKKLTALFDVVKDAFSMMLSVTIGIVFMLIVCMTVMAKIGG